MTGLKSSQLALIAILVIPTITRSADKDAKPFDEQHVIFQVSDADPAKHAVTLAIANNLIKHYKGPDFVDIEVIAFGKGVRMMFAENNDNETRIRSLMDNGVRFYVCLNTLNSMQRKTGKRAEVLTGVTGVQTGVAFMVEEISAGYIHIHP